MDSIFKTLAIAVFIPVVLAAITPFISRLSRKGVLQQDKEDALNRLQLDPHVFVGAEMSGIYVADRKEPLVPACAIVGLNLEQIVVKIIDDEHEDFGCEHSFTLMEFEKLHPRMVLPDFVSA